MSILLVTFDANRVGQDYHGVTTFLRAYKHVFLAEGSYAIETHEGTRTVYNKVSHFLAENIHVFVLTLTQPFTTSQRLGDVKNWLAKHLPQM